MGAVALPLFTQFGPEALEHRLQHSAARALVTDGENLPKIDAIRSTLPELRYILVVDRENGANTDFWAALERASPNFTAVDTARTRSLMNLSLWQTKEVRYFGKSKE